MQNLDFLLGEDDFISTINEKVIPEISAICEEYYLPVKNGTIHTKIYKNPNAKKVVVLCHGYTEFIEKYAEIIYNFLQLGFSVAMCEHRGHGFSHRMSKNIHKVHIDSFNTYVADFAKFTNYVQKQFPELPMYLFAHSMGGCIGALYIERYKKPYKRAILSSPMLELKPKDMPVPVTIALSKVMILFGKGEQTPSPAEFSPSENFEESSCASRARFDRNMALRIGEPYYQTVIGTLSWLSSALSAVQEVQRRARLITIPVLVVNTGKDTLVKEEGQRKFIEKVPRGKFISLPDAKHEAFNADDKSREIFWSEIANFFK